jgi:hypothetical protein
MSDRRFLVLHLPQLATDRIRQKEPELAGTPIATARSGRDYYRVELRSGARLRPPRCIRA